MLLLSSYGEVLVVHEQPTASTTCALAASQHQPTCSFLSIPTHLHNHNHPNTCDRDVKPQGVSTSVEFKELFGKRRTEPGEGLGDLLPHQLGIFLCDGGSAFDGGLSRAPDKPGCGSPYYMASELLTAAGYTEVVDVYSAGITYTEMK